MIGKSEIYGLFDPVTGGLRYVGKANNSASRLKYHLKDCYRRDTPVCHWLCDLLSKGLPPKLLVLACCDVNHWQEVERAMIFQYRREGIALLNVAVGGNAPFCSPEVRAANGRKTDGRAIARNRVDTEFKARLYKAKRTLGIARGRGWPTDDQKKAMRYCARKAPHLFGNWLDV